MRKSLWEMLNQRKHQIKNKLRCPWSGLRETFCPTGGPDHRAKPHAQSLWWQRGGRGRTTTCGALMTAKLQGVSILCHSTFAYLLPLCLSLSPCLPLPLTLPRSLSLSLIIHLLLLDWSINELKDRVSWHRGVFSGKKGGGETIITSSLDFERLFYQKHDHVGQEYLSQFFLRKACYS